MHADAGERERVGVSHATTHDTIQCTDDCQQDPALSVSFPDLVDGCANTQVVASCTDWSGCANANTDEQTFYVRYDDERPIVTVTLGQFLNKKNADGRKWEDIPLTITVNDKCVCSILPCML